MSVTVDMRQFMATFRRYAQVTSKSMAQALNHKAGDIALHAAHFAPRSPMAVVDLTSKGLEKLSWWPKFISRVVAEGAISRVVRRKAKTAAERDVWWTDPATGKRKFGRKSLGERVVFRGGKKVNLASGREKKMKTKDYQRVSEILLKRRAVRIGGVRAVLALIANKFGVKATRVGDKRAFRAYNPLKKATAQSLSASWRVTFKGAKWPYRGNAKRVSARADAEGKRVIYQRALDQSVAFVTADMKQDIIDKLRGAARTARAA
jgi:hypothetical protein